MTSPALLSSRKRVDRVVDMMVEDMMVVDMMVVDITSTVPHTLSATTTIKTSFNTGQKKKLKLLMTS